LEIGFNSKRCAETAEPCSRTGPEISPALLATGRGQFSLNIDRRVKGSPQSRIVDPCDMPFENSCTPWIVERG
jgi:hypothetical protein